MICRYEIHADQLSLDRVHQFPPLYDCLPRRLSILVKTAQVPREELHKLVVMLISTHRASRTNTTRARRIWRQRDREDLAIGTLVGVFRVMFNVCRVEASDHEQDSGAGRFGGEMLEWMALCLPSLRIASKWMRW
ncbi:MAG: hypothetical protein EOO77_07135 [Oxalobacteraceae bacterium]|nr:MAG: hypothetical protein EOO77_07135 [Oxalobacteraceae bacterium]